VAVERPADLQAAKEMPDPEHVLAVKDDFHITPAIKTDGGGALRPRPRPADE
jgi:hypothetical protein